MIKDLGLNDPAQWRTVAKVALFLAIAVPVFFVGGAVVIISTGGGLP